MSSCLHSRNVSYISDIFSFALIFTPSWKYIMLICRFSIQDHHDLKLYRLSSTIKNFVEIKKTDSLACIGNDQNAQCGGCFGFSNVLFWLQKANASTLDRRQMKTYLNFTNQTTFILFVFLSSSFWNCITQGSHSYCYNAVFDQIYTSASFLASSKLDPPPSSISMEKKPWKYGSSKEHICIVLFSLTLATQFVFCDKLCDFNLNKNRTPL